MEFAILSGIIINAFLLVAVLIVSIKNKPSRNETVEHLSQKLDILFSKNNDSIDRLTNRMNDLTSKNYEQQIEMMKLIGSESEKQAVIVSKAVESMQKSNEEKLEQMRKTVDEKLESTLNKRINASFNTVSEQLNNVYNRLGEMKELSTGVTDSVMGLNRVLTNVKSRGTWAEVQLGNILDQTIPAMYDTNVQTNPSYNGRVEFAIRIPNQEDGSFIYLPVDSKFPMEDYARLSVAADEGNLEALEASKKALEQRIKEEAKHIKQYISSPETTPFAIMYLATEGLYAEVTSSKTGLAEKLQNEGVMVAGPSTITALLNSLALGFRTIAINEKANEVWKLLGAAKAQHDKFGVLIEKAKRKVEEAGNVLEDASKRNDIIQKNLKRIEELDASASNSILGLDD